MQDFELTQEANELGQKDTAGEDGSSVAEPKAKARAKKATLPAGLTFSKEQLIAVADLVSTPDRPEEEEAFEELYRSIKAAGILVPIIIREKDDRNEIVDGRRRFAAGVRAGLTVMPCKVIEGAADIATDRLVSLIANRVRLGESPWSQARKLQAAKDDGWSFAQIVAFTGFSKSTVSDLLFATSKQMTEEDQKRLDRGDNLFKVVKARKEALKPKDNGKANETPEAEGSDAGAISQASDERAGKSARSPIEREYKHKATGLTITIRAKSKRNPTLRNVIAALRDILQGLDTTSEHGEGKSESSTRLRT